ncbi:MAG: hypothetical protein HOM72_06100, partial [Actinobacteria bacterium]|nr:hypothetical protein [Actinomycetota bacterium]
EGLMMLMVCWSLKGGMGTTVVAAGLALSAARAGKRPWLIDLDGDLPSVLGVDGAGPGMTDWCSALDGPECEAIEQLATEVSEMRLVGRGMSSWDDAISERMKEMAEYLVGLDQTVVVDAGNLFRSGPPQLLIDPLLAVADRSILVTRACYLALRRVPIQTHRPTEVALTVEPGRALGRADVEQVVGAPVTMRVLTDPAIARAVDSGLMARRTPRVLLRGVGAAS